MAAEETILNGRYRLIKQQGSGGMAVVYQAEDLALSRSVAVKILRPSLTSDPQFLVRFRQEARNVANLSHPNIVTLHDVGQDGNTYYMVMEYIDGQDLKKIVRTNAPLPLERALHLAIQICAGLGYAHRAMLVHADVKPQNILITAGDMVKVTDFGIAQALSHTQPLEKATVVWGSPHYFSPEQAKGEPPTPASDVYAIGIVMYEMLTGKLPYGGTSGEELAQAHVREQVPHVRDLNPNVPENIDWLVHKVMSKEPAQRYRSADQLGRILTTYAAQLAAGIIAKPPSQPGQPTPGAAPSGGTGKTGTLPPTPLQPGQSAPLPMTGDQPGSIGNPIFKPPVAPVVRQQPGNFTGSPASPVTTGSPAVGTPPGAQSAPQQPYIQTGFTPQEPARPVGYTPPQPQPAITHFQPQAMDLNPSGRSERLPTYSYNYIPPQPTRFNAATILLAGMALVLVLGLIVLYLFVWSAYTG